MEALCCIGSGIVVWMIIRGIFSGSKQEKEVETKIVRVVVEPPPMPPRPAPEAPKPAPEPKVEPPRPTKCPSCGASLGRSSTCEYCGDGR
jgi:hypothetical protein